MSRKKGTKKTGGRVKGTPNKATQNFRDWISDLVDENRTQITRDLKNLDSKDRLIILEKLMQYCIPKMQSVEAKIDFNTLSDAQLNMIINELTKDVP